MATGDQKYLFVDRDKGSSVYRAVGKYLEKRGDWKRQAPDSPRFNLMLGDRNRLPWHVFGQVAGLTQVVNYYRGSEVLCRKTSMTRVLKDHIKKTKQRPFPWLPKSFVLLPHLSSKRSASDSTQPAGHHTAHTTDNDRQQAGHRTAHTTDNDRQQAGHRTAHTKNDDRQQLLELSKNSSEDQCAYWIVKRSAGSKGDGIKISGDVQELLHYIDSQGKAFVCQQYVHPPLLLSHGRKFDIRCWVLLDLWYNIYLYREGVLRTASDPYSDDLSHVTAHLTNHSLQKELSDHFGQYEEGNEMFFEDFDSYLKTRHGVSLESKILPQIRTITRTCFSIIQEQINTGTAGYWSFQLFGLDFMVDQHLKVWLIEINGAPACASKLLPDMVRCIVETTIDPAFPPTVKVAYRENLFDKI